MTTDLRHLEDGQTITLARNVGTRRWDVQVTRYGDEAMYFELYEEGHRLGRALFSWPAAEELHLDYIGLMHHARQRQGIGTALMQVILAALPSLGIRRVRGHTTARDRQEQPWLLDWYGRLGFRWIGALDTPGNLPMWWETPAATPQII